MYFFQNSLFANDGVDDQSKAVDPKPFKCQQCPKSFSKMQNLQVHQATHSGVRPFSCHNCSKAFMRKRELER